MKVRCKPLGLLRIHAAKFVANFKTGGGRLAVFVEHLKRELAGLLAVKEQIDIAAEAEILRSLANVEAELGVAFASVATVKLDAAILQGQATERFGERLGIVHRQAKPTIDDLALRRIGVRSGVWAAGDEFRSNTGLVVDLNQETAPALL